MVTSSTELCEKGLFWYAVLPRNPTAAYGIGIHQHDQEGRVITLSFLILPGECLPQFQRGQADYRMTWEDDFRNIYWD